MTGSGNDFVFFDVRHQPPGVLERAGTIGAICDRRLGVGADGVVFLEPAIGSAYQIRYFNRDGSLAELCGNASLCSVALARELGIVAQGIPFSFVTSSGPLQGLFGDDGPRVSMPAVADADPAFPAPLEPGERRLGFARVGVPHLVVLCQDVAPVEVARRGSELRHLPNLAAGANANFVARSGSGWTYRTYERGVEEETLACGSGSVAVAAMLGEWGQAASPVRLKTRSGATLTVSFGDGGPELAGEGRIVFEGRLRDYLPAWLEG